MIDHEFKELLEETCFQIQAELAELPDTEENARRRPCLKQEWTLYQKALALLAQDREYDAKHLVKGAIYEAEREQRFLRAVQENHEALEARLRSEGPPAN